MSIRITCPSCSTELSIKDEFAGREVQCPKCGGIIPPTPHDPYASPPERSATPDDSSHGNLDSPRQPAGTRNDDEHNEGNDSEKGRAAKRRRDYEEDERMSQRRRRREEEDDADRLAREKKKGGSGALTILAVIGGIMLVCCGGLGVLGYFVYLKVKEGVEKIQEVIKESTNPNVTSDNYQKLKPNITKAEVEAIMGPGKVANAALVTAAFQNKSAQNRKILNSLQPLAEQGRMLMWQNMGEFILVAFTDKPDTGGKLYMKVYVHPTGIVESDTVVDGKFVHDKTDDLNALKPSKPQPEDKNGGVVLTVSAAKLIGDYDNDADAADKKYASKRLLVTDGIVDSWENGFIALIKSGGGNQPKKIRVEFLDEQQQVIAKYKQGAKIKFRAMIVDGDDDPIEMDHGWIVP